MNTKAFFDKVKSEPQKLISIVVSALMIAAGAIVISLPVFFWDFLVTYQFKPTARVLYPLFYGIIGLGGLAIVALGVLGFINKFQFKRRPKYKWSGYILPALSVIGGFGLFFGYLSTYLTAEYLSADNLYRILVCGMTLFSVLLVILTVSGGIAIFSLIKKKEVGKVFRLANSLILILAVVGLTAVSIITLPPDAELKPFPEDLPLVTSLYARGDSGYDTFKIPTMIKAPNGTLLAFAEARSENKEDWGPMDVVVRKSYDLGETWTPLEVLLKEGDLTIGNACPVVDRDTGYIWLIFCKENDTAFKMFSADNGESWSEPVEITSSVKLSGWTWYATGPSHGIQMNDGTLIIPADHIENRKMMAHVIYSEDHGETWKLGGTVGSGEEATVAELDNGDLYINVRPVRPGYRVTAISKDKGKTWTEYGYDKGLPDPACEGCLVKMPTDGGGVYLFTNAADKLHREKMTVRVSYDQCKNWQKSKVLYEGMASYSALCVLDADSGLIGCIFERGANYYAEEIVFTRFPLSLLG